MVKSIVNILVFIFSFQALRAANVTITIKKDTVCTGATIPLKGSFSLSIFVIKWQWKIISSTGVTILPNDSAQNITANFADTGNYVVTLYVYYNTGGVSITEIDSQKVSVRVIQSAKALFTTSGINKGVPQTISFVNTSTNAPNGYVWNFGDNSTLTQNNVVATLHTYQAVGIYTITLVAYGAKGCNDTLSAPFTINDTAGLAMPNIFTPNGDDINDVYMPNAHGMKTLLCTIYDRYGIKIVDLDNTNIAYWDGYTTSGIACTDGTYFYVVTATDLNNKTYNLRGFLQLIR
ncbi:MAG: T9SS type B sorting domain-containing protein [Bacteroidia bacterium]